MTNESDYKAYFMHVANSIVPNYKIIPENKEVYANLFNYFHGLDSCYDKEKGIALIGKFGVGKTTLFNIFHKYLSTIMRVNPNLYIVSSVENLINELSDGAWIEKKLSLNIKSNARGSQKPDPKNVLINEFGFNYNIKSYGTNVSEFIDAWIMKRYDIYQEYGKLTHITSNFGTSELKELFHPKIVDRLKEMFNIVELNGNSYR